jgi:hypothetical protein
MRVFTLVIAGAALALAFGSVDSQPRAHAGERSVLGAGEAGLLDEKFRFDTESGTGHLSTSFRRALVKVPKAYGNLVAVTESGGKSILWFQGQGIARNVILDSDALYQVQPE